ncbi:MAG TPA: hypothetical protein VMK12_29105 [Anaeromyxobacteraceae bacterium]|nr:hypothetical protein [Anaeromyxobacteraceae bacterium]
MRIVHVRVAWRCRRGPRRPGPATFLDNTDVVGLYLNPPQKAVVRCVDEKKSQIQALDRTQAGLPLEKGACFAT